MKVELIDYTRNAVQKIGRAALICYDGTNDLDANIRRVKHCKDKGHLAVLRFSYATANIQGISRVCSHQLVRVAHAGILQESQRYVKQTNIEYIMPPAFEALDEITKLRWQKAQNECSYIYNEAIKAGMKKEDARYILPQSCTTQLNMCLNFQGWRDLLKNRTGKTAQWEIQNVAFEIERQLQGIAPEVFCHENTGSV